MRTRIVLFILLAILFGNEPTSAQISETPDESEPRYWLDVIVTTAYRETERLFSPVEKITAEELREHAATTMAEALDLLPGLRSGVARVGHGEYVSLRGFEQQHLLILIDGVPIYNPYDGLLELDHLPAGQIQSIRMIKGSASAQYGPNGLGGVISIITRNPKEQEQSNIDAQLGENGSFGLRLGSGHHIGRWTFHLSGSRNRSDGFRLSKAYREIAVPNLPSGQGTLSYEDGGWRDNSDYVKDAAHASIAYLPNDRFRLDLSGGLVNNRWGVPPHPVYNPDKNKSTIRFWRFQEWRQGSINLAASARIGENLWTNLGIFYNAYDNALDGYDDDTYSSQEKPYAFHSVYDDHALGGRFHLNAMLGRLGSITLGAGLIDDVHKDTPDREETADEYEMRTWWLGLEDRLRLSERMWATAGINCSLLEKKKAAHLTDAGSDLTAANPSISLAALISRSSRIYISWSGLSRFPTMKELYGQDGNPRLAVQRSQHVELGGEWTAAAWEQLHGSLFYDRIRDLIEGNYTSPTHANIDRATLIGGELTLRGHVVSRVRHLFSYSCIRSRNESDHPLGKYLQYRPEHQLDWNLTADLPFGVTLCFDGSAFSRRYFYDDFHDQRLSQLPSYQVANLCLRRRFSLGVEPYLSMKNMFDKSFQHVYTSPAPGRELRGGIEMNW